ncbi:hypothetical protein B7P43_G02412 [Cryptotermes secundus]|uniref:Uncharacterized protein n=1 Tax=Cryptotermes secundus TaxID=105785 RepID=A0A2J7R406_9NEOP|nr:hypothetical protein B7P43_G02412 [Cryptotermes secundus]
MIATFLTDELATRFPQVSEASLFQQDGKTSVEDYFITTSSPGMVTVLGLLGLHT